MRICKLFLVGFMGTGKTVVGQCLADRLGWAFRDADATIEERTGCSVPHLFQEFGEARFRQEESQAIASLAANPGPAVVACGGGAVLADDNIYEMKAAGLVVCLSASLDDILRRTEDDSRPLLTGPDRGRRVQALLAQRRGRYELAHLTVASVDGVEETATAVLRAIKASGYSLDGV